MLIVVSAANMDILRRYAVLLCKLCALRARLSILHLSTLLTTAHRQTHGQQKSGSMINHQGSYRYWGWCYMPTCYFLWAAAFCPLSPAEKAQCDPNRTRLDVIGSFTAVLEWHSKKSTQIVYVLRGCSPSSTRAWRYRHTGNDQASGYSRPQQWLRGQEAISRPIHRPRMHGRWLHNTAEKKDAKPFTVFTPQSVPVNLLPQLKDELDKL